MKKSECFIQNIDMRGGIVTYNDIAEKMETMSSREYGNLIGRLGIDYAIAKGGSKAVGAVTDALVRFEGSAISGSAFFEGLHQQLGIFRENPQFVTPEGITLSVPTATKTAAELAADAKAAAEAAQAIAQGATATIPTGDAGNLLRQDNQNTTGGGDAKKVEWAAYKSKHKPKKGMPWKKVVRSTETGVAKYKPEINIKDIELHAWYNGTPVTTPGKNFKVFKSDSIIGAKWGKETCFMRVECSANTIHGHPISEAEYLKYLRKQ